MPFQNLFTHLFGDITAFVGFCLNAFDQGYRERGSGNETLAQICVNSTMHHVFGLQVVNMMILFVTPLNNFVMLSLFCLLLLLLGIFLDCCCLDSILKIQKFADAQSKLSESLPSPTRTLLHVCPSQVLYQRLVPSIPHHFTSTSLRLLLFFSSFFHASQTNSLFLSCIANEFSFLSCIANKYDSFHASPTSLHTHTAHIHSHTHRHLTLTREREREKRGEETETERKREALLSSSF